MSRHLLRAVWLLLLLGVLPASQAWAQDATNQAAAADAAARQAVPTLGPLQSFIYAILTQTDNSGLGCPLVTGAALGRFVSPYRITLRYAEGDYTVHVAADLSVVVLCDAKFPGLDIVQATPAPDATPGAPATVPPGVILTLTPVSLRAPSATGCTLTAIRANVRQQPSTESTILGEIVSGQVADVIGRTADNSWWQVAGYNGWVASTVSTVVGATCAGLPVVGQVVADYGPCPANYTGFVAPRLAVGGAARVPANARPQPARQEPTVSAPVVFSLAASDVVPVVSGPVCGNGFVWWQVRSGQTLGWAAETDAASGGLLLEVASAPPAGAPAATPTAALTPEALVLAADADAALRTLASPDAPTTPMLALAVSPAGGVFATVTEGEVGPRTWNADGSAGTAAYPHDTFVQGVAFSPDGAWLASTDLAGNVRVWDLAGSPIAVLRVPPSSAAPSTLLTAFDAVWNVLAAASCAQLSTDPLAPCARGEVTLVSTADSQAQWTQPFDGAPHALAVQPDGARVAVGTDAGVLTYTALSGLPALALETDLPPRALAYTPDGATLLAGGCDAYEDPAAPVLTCAAGVVRAYASDDGTLLATLGALDGGEVVALAASPDGTRVAVGTSDGVVLVLALPAADAPADAPLTTIVTWRAHAGPVTGLAFTPDGATVLSSGADGAARLWRAE